MRSMSIKSLLIAIFSILIVLLSALFGTLTYLSGAHNQISDAEHRRFQSFKLADELRQSSDDLTRMARTYVATGDERYAKYYQEILDIRNGVAPRPLHYDLVYWDLVGPDGQRPTEFGKPAALQLLMVAQNFTNVEFSKLREAQANSDDLVHLEVVAMNAVVGKFDDGSGEFLLVGEPDFELARGLMFSLDYHAAKAKIMAPINEFLIMLDMRTAREVARNTRAAKDLMVVALIISAVTVLFCISSFMVIRNRVLKPLVMIADSARVVSEGDYDRPVEYRSRDEVGTLVRAFNAMIASTKASFTTIREANEKLERHLKQIEDELAMAQQMQMSILPKQLPNRSDITMFGRMTAAREVGGDFYDVIEIDDDRIGIVIADVSGKGVPAALFMAVSCTVIKSIAARGGQPGHVVALANDILCDGNDAAMFVTVFYGIMNNRTGELTYCNAGHNPPILLSDGQEAQRLEIGGPVLGVLPDFPYQQATVALNPGDLLLIFSDGFSEAMNRRLEEFGEDQLIRLAAQNRGDSAVELIEKISQAVVAHTGDEPQTDDMTIMAVRVDK